MGTSIIRMPIAIKLLVMIETVLWKTDSGVYFVYGSDIKSATSLAILKDRHSRMFSERNLTESAQSLSECGFNCQRTPWCLGFNVLTCNHSGECGNNCELLGGEMLKSSKLELYNHYVVVQKDKSDQQAASRSPMLTSGMTRKAATMLMTSQTMPGTRGMTTIGNIATTKRIQRTWNTYNLSTFDVMPSVQCFYNETDCLTHAGTWENAKLACEDPKYKLKLVSSNLKERQDFLNETLHRTAKCPPYCEFWIGLNGTATLAANGSYHYEWHWTCGCRFWYQAWDIGEPKKELGTHHAFLNMTSGLWASTTEYKKYYYACSNNLGP